MLGIYSVKGIVEGGSFIRMMLLNFVIVSVSVLCIEGVIVLVVMMSDGLWICSSFFMVVKIL